MSTQKNHLNETVLLSIQNICADPGIIVRGVQVSQTKKALTFFFVFFFSPQLILQKSNGQFQRNLSFFKVPEGFQHFRGGGGTNCLFPIETHITCDFPGGVRTPSPLWICTCGVADELEHRHGLSLKVNCSAMHGIDGKKTLKWLTLSCAPDNSGLL